jgi:hypothetical protein
VSHATNERGKITTKLLNIKTVEEIPGSSSAAGVRSLASGRFDLCEGGIIILPNPTFSFGLFGFVTI